MGDAFWLGLCLGAVLGMIYHVCMRRLFIKNLLLAQRAGVAVFLDRAFFYLLPASAVIEKNLWYALETVTPIQCPHGYVGDWSDECPDCRH